MHVIQARNINDAYHQGMQLIATHGVRQQSRAGEVLVIDRPVTTVYNAPMERVLFDPKRDANPFFHLFESIWMLAGWRDARWLDQFVGDFSKRFAEDDGDAHGAYGYRWRNHWHREGGPIDQLVECGKLLLNDPTTRQSVMAMWDPMIDLGAKKRDIPCNDMIMFRGRYDHMDKIWLLDATVLCRSNDIIWGAYGANAVHMSFMHEVVAALAGMMVGKYYQVSNNYHAYADIFQKMHPPVSFSQVPDNYRLGVAQVRSIFSEQAYSYVNKPARKGISTYAEQFLAECAEFMRGHPVPKQTLFFQDIAWPMIEVHQLWKDKKKTEAMNRARAMKPSDWQLAALQWMMRRMSSLNPTEDVRSK